MDYKKNIVLNGLKICSLEQSFLLELPEVVKLVNEPSHDQDEALYLANNLIC